MYTRRQILNLLGLAGACVAAGGFKLSEFVSEGIKKRKIPSTGEELPVVGVGTWQTFDVGTNKDERNTLKEVLKVMKEKGGRVIDSSPMYGSSEEVVGDLTNELEIQDYFFYATKVWTSGRGEGIKQMNDSFRKMKRNKIDLMQIHNLVDWQTHLKTLRTWKEEGKIRYIGVTHYTESAYPRLEEIIENEKIDFVQFNYSIDSREAEKRLLPAAKDQGVAVLINRPFGGGTLFGKVRGKEVPTWAKENNISGWGEFFLKFILTSDAVTCIIPGTSKPNHMLDNIQAGYGELPDKGLRDKMVRYIKQL